MSSLCIDDLSLVGINHDKGDLAVREQLAITPDQVPGLLGKLHKQDIANESMVLSTCNRIELYCVSNAPERALNLLLQREGKDMDGFRDLFYVKRGIATIEHSFEVAGGLQSMILGETEIFGQMKRAYQYARQANFAGVILDRLFTKTFNVAKKIRSDTDIGKASVSMPVICAKLAENIFGPMGDNSVLCIGAGAIIDNVMHHMAERKVKRLAVTNRTLAHAERLARSHGAEIVAYEDFSQHLCEFDVIFSATNSVLPMIGKGAFERELQKRKRKPIAAFDLAVPRDIEPEAEQLEDLFLYTIDNIGKISSANLERRRSALDKARRHIEQATTELVSSLGSVDSVEAIKRLRNRVDRIRDEEVRHGLAQLAKGTPADEAIKLLANRLANKLANAPLQSLHRQRDNNDMIEELDSWYTDEQQDKPKDTGQA